MTQARQDAEHRPGRQPPAARGESLPDPVARYLAHALGATERPLQLARHDQAGTLRTDPLSDRWMTFSATQLTRPAALEFAWTASVQALPGVHLRVQDALRGGHGHGKVSLWSLVPVAVAHPGPEMDAGSLHRFLAEAVWYPTALLASPHLHWSAIDDQRALATLRHGATCVSLEFRFNDQDEVAGIYTPARWGQFKGRFRQLPWEGRFAGYQRVQGLLIPRAGEVGWHLDGEWRAVWRGSVVRSELVFA